MLDNDTSTDQITCNCQVHDIDSFLDKANFEKISYLNTEGNFEEKVGCLTPKMKKNPKRFSGLVKSLTPQVDNVYVILMQKEQTTQYQTQKQQKLKTQNVPLTYFPDDDIMNKIVDHTKIRINETITRLQRAEGYNKSLGKYTWVKITDKIEFDALSGMMYFRGLLGVNV